MSCAPNSIWMRQPGTENSLLCLGNLIHHEVSISNFAHPCSIWAVGTFGCQLRSASRMRKKDVPQNHTRGFEFGMSGFEAKEESFQKASKEFPCGTFFFSLLWKTQDLGRNFMVQQLNHKLTTSSALTLPFLNYSLCPWTNHLESELSSSGASIGPPNPS